MKQFLAKINKRSSGANRNGRHTLFKKKVDPKTTKNSHVKFDDRTALKNVPNIDQLNEQQNFHKSISNILTVACILGFFPVHGLRGKRQDLRFQKYSSWGLLSLFTILTLIWISVILLIQTMRSVMKFTSGKTGGIVNSTAGLVFYVNATISSILLRKVARGWSNIMYAWDKLERRSPPPPYNKFRMNMIAFVVLVFSIKHVLSMAINAKNCRREITWGNSTIRRCLEEYSTNSHSFIFATVPYSIPFGIFVFFVSKIATLIWNFQDLFLILISLGIVAQFKHTNKLIMQIDTTTSRVSDWRFVRDVYMGCAELTRDIGDLLSSLVLLSFLNNLYFICLQMLNGLAPHLQGLVENIYFFGSFVYMITRLVCVALTVAEIPLEARRSLCFLRCTPTSAYCSEIERLSCQISNDEVAFTGMGYFTVNRNFMLGVAGAIATYEVVLLQFDTYDT